MKVLREALEAMKKGFAHSHSGDYLTGSEKIKAIGDIDASSIVLSNLESQRKRQLENKRTKKQSIAMYLGSELPRHLMDYMIETSLSLGHDLLVLTFESASITEQLLKPYQEELTEKNINLRRVKLSGNPMEELNNHLKSHPEIVFLACKDNGFLGRSYLSGNSAKINLSVPVVVVSEDNATNTATVDNDTVKHLKVANL